LVMPGMVDESRQIFRWLADEISPDTFVNIMPQYRPAYQVGQIAETGRDAGKPRYEEIDRPPTPAELQEAHEAASQAGLWRFD
ncbi:MAG: radical SAM protein, partial [Planctomycetota bacterium]